MKRYLLKTAALALAVICAFLFGACENDHEKDNAEPTPSQSNVETEKESSAPASSTGEIEEGKPVTPPEASGEAIAKITGGADEVGIYSIVIRLTDKAADKGVVEMVYYGAKGSPQENSVVNTFRIEYYKETSGTFEIHTFYDGEADQNYHHKDKVNVTNTFGATLRAGKVIVSYTPDGGETTEIFRADADYFYSPAN